MFPTRLTELEALPVCQLLVQAVSQDGGQQKDRPADGWEDGGDQAVGHEGKTTFGCGCIPYIGNKIHCETGKFSYKKHSKRLSNSGFKKQHSTFVTVQLPAIQFNSILLIVSNRQQKLSQATLQID